MAVATTWIISNAADAEPGTGPAIALLQEAAGKGNQDQVVARVDDRDILLRDVTGALAFGSVPGAASRDGASASSLTAEQALQGLIDSAAVAVVAERAGIRVDDEDVNLMIERGILDGLVNPNLAAEQKVLLVEWLKFNGTSADTVLTHARTRAGMRDILLRNQYSATRGGVPWEQLAIEARETVEIEIVPGALAK